MNVNSVGENKEDNYKYYITKWKWIKFNLKIKKLS